MRNPWNVVLILVTVAAIVFMAVVANHGQSSVAAGEQQQNLFADTASVLASSAIATSSDAATVAPFATTTAVTITPTSTGTGANAKKATVEQSQKSAVATPASKPTPSQAASTPAPVPIVIILPAPAPTSSPAVAATTTATTTPAASSTASSTPTSTTASSTGVALPYSLGTFGNNFAAGDGWTSWWGGEAQDGGVLTVEGTPTDTGGGVALTGSTAWTDYTFQADVDWIKGQTFGLIARYVDDNDYVLCNFDERSVGTISLTIEKYVDGKSTTIANGAVNNYEQAGGVGITAVVGVRGNEAICSFNGTQITAYSLGDDPAASLSGGIGFKAWDPQVNNSEIIVHSAGVTSGLFNAGSSS